MKKLIYLFLLTVFLSISCDSDYLPNQESTIVVEGWIENGGFPVVMLTRTLPVSEESQDISNLEDYLLRWATVTISNGEESVILTGKYDPGYFPPFIYTTGKMRGEAGKTYDLTVEYRNFHAKASTTIPHPVAVDTFMVEKCADSDTLFQITIGFNDNPNEKNYYKVFTRTGSKNKQYLSAYLGIVDDAVMNGYTRIPAYRGPHIELDDYTPYFLISDTVSVKFAHIDEQSYRFWNDYEKVLSLSGNMFFPMTQSIHSNITGGIGYWCGYGVITKHFIIADYAE